MKKNIEQEILEIYGGVENIQRHIKDIIQSKIDDDKQAHYFSDKLSNRLSQFCKSIVNNNQSPVVVSKKLMRNIDNISHRMHVEYYKSKKLSANQIKIARKYLIKDFINYKDLSKITLSIGIGLSEIYEGLLSLRKKEMLSLAKEMNIDPSDKGQLLMSMFLSALRYSEMRYDIRKEIDNDS